jgi:hypothetical protein
LISTRASLSRSPRDRRCRRFDGDANARRVESGTQAFDHGAGERGQVHGLETELLPAREPEQLADQPLDPLELLEDDHRPPPGRTLSHGCDVRARRAGAGARGDVRRSGASLQACMAGADASCYFS